MQAPPYSEPPKNNSTKIILIMVGVVVIGGCAIIAIGAAVLFPVFSQARLAAKDAHSLSNLKTIGVALQMYAANADDHLPLAANWEQAQLDTRTVRDATIFADPNLADGGIQPHGYALNLAASGVEITKLEYPNRFVVIFASKVQAMNASGGREDLRLTQRGKVLVGFADAGCRAAKLEDTGSYQWSPK